VAGCLSRISSEIELNQVFRVLGVEKIIIIIIIISSRFTCVYNNNTISRMESKVFVGLLLCILFCVEMGASESDSKNITLRGSNEKKNAVLGGAIGGKYTHTNCLIVNCHDEHKMNTNYDLLFVFLGGIGGALDGAFSKPGNKSEKSLGLSVLGATIGKLIKLIVISY